MARRNEEKRTEYQRGYAHGYERGLKECGPIAGITGILARGRKKKALAARREAERKEKESAALAGVLAEEAAEARAAQAAVNPLPHGLAMKPMFALHLRGPRGKGMYVIVSLAGGKPSIVGLAEDPYEVKGLPEIDVNVSSAELRRWGAPAPRARRGESNGRSRAVKVRRTRRNPGREKGPRSTIRRLLRA